MHLDLLQVWNDTNCIHARRASIGENMGRTFGGVVGRHSQAIRETAMCSASTLGHDFTICSTRRRPQRVVRTPGLCSSVYCGLLCVNAIHCVCLWVRALLLCSLLADDEECSYVYIALHVHWCAVDVWPFRAVLL